MAKNFLATQGWLSFSPSTPRLYITAEDEEFDPSIIKAWEDEGFLVGYIPMGNGGAKYKDQLAGLGRGLSVGEKYAIVAFGDAASIVLESHITPHPCASRLCCIIAYYPTRIPTPSTRYPSSIRVLTHLCGTHIDVSHIPEILGIQGKRKSVTKRLTPGAGTGGLQLGWGFRAYTYPNVSDGFAERDLEGIYDGIADGLAWSRSLDLARRAFGAETELEAPLEAKLNTQWRQPSDDIDALLDAYTEADEPAPTLLNTPTLVGGVGATALEHFYDEHFVPGSLDEKDDLKLTTTLLSRTVGPTSIVDELHLALTHSCVVPWLLPGIPPTQKAIEVIVMCIVGLRGGKIWCERMYWDHASVLAQVGLIDARHVPAGMKKKGVGRLPVVGKEGAQKVVELVRKGEKVSGVEGDDGLDGLNHMLRGL